ncbi:MAG: DUF2157 domain-containing protein, partial [Epsilonproteobacteria bacterium]|nr:DUF2157 domain-containing protein [Campylobacterota bacterium]
MKISNRNILINLIDNQNIKPQNIPKALKELQIIPTAKSWHNFIDKLLLWFGALSLAFAVLFFVAYNWSELGRFGKFALVEGLLIISIGVYLFTTSGTDGFSLAFFGTLVPCTLFEKVSDSEELLSKVTLMVSSLLVGTLLALVGQIYQTGADSWELFFYWAL